MTKRTQDLMLKTPIKSLQISNVAIANDARATRPGMKWVLELERARLLTESYKQTEGEPMVIRRAKGLAHILNNMSIYIRPGELIVGNFASNPDAVVYYPELAYHWIERETSPGNIYQDLLNDQERKELKEINAYWKNYAVHNNIRNYLPKDLADIAYAFNFECATPNFEKILHVGLKGFLEETENRIKKLQRDYLNKAVDGMNYIKKKNFLDAVVISLKATINWAKRYSKLAMETAQTEKDPVRRRELENIARNCEWVPENPARTYWEALQSFWLIHLVINFIELPMVGDGIRFDVCLSPFYERDLKEGNITRDGAQELVECIFIKSQETGFLHPTMWSGAGGGAIGFQTLTIGGTDSNGNDASNEVSLIVLDAMKNVRTVTPPLALRWHDKIPKKLIEKTIEVLADGMPQPAVFNDKVNIPRLVSFGISIEDARNYSINNCMVPTIPGKNLNHRSAWATSLPLPLFLTAALGLGVIPGFFKKPLGKPINEPEKISSIDELLNATMENCRSYMEAEVQIHNIGDALYQEYLPRPLLSAILDDSIERAQDIREWNWGFGYREVCPVGLNNLADAIAAIKRLVFEEKKVSMADLIQALRNDWNGSEALRKLFLEAPKFGNDDDYVDSISFQIAKQVSEQAKNCSAYLGQPLYADGTVASAWWMIGSLCPATPDGRKAGETFHDGTISPMGGRDRKGPTAVLKSVSKVDPLLTWNHLFNQTFMPQYLEGHNAVAFAQYLKSSMDLGVHHIQFSVVGRETLIEAQKNPEKYTNLMVRVAGYSAYFIDLNKNLQDQIISRTPQCF